MARLALRTLLVTSFLAMAWSACEHDEYPDVETGEDGMCYIKTYGPREFKCDGIFIYMGNVVASENECAKKVFDTSGCPFNGPDGQEIWFASDGNECYCCLSSSGYGNLTSSFVGHNMYLATLSPPTTAPEGYQPDCADNPWIPDPDSVCEWIDGKYECAPGECNIKLDGPNNVVCESYYQIPTVGLSLHECAKDVYFEPNCPMNGPSGTDKWFTHYNSRARTGCRCCNSSSGWGLLKRSDGTNMYLASAATQEPTMAPTSSPTNKPTLAPTPAPTNEPTPAPTPAPTNEPTLAPTPSPPTNEPTQPLPYEDASKGVFSVQVPVAVKVVVSLACFAMHF